MAKSKAGRKFLTWEQLATIQIGVVELIPAPLPVQVFIAAALYDFALRHAIIPSIRPRPYLDAEPSGEQVATQQARRKLGPGDWEREIWRLR